MADTIEKIYCTDGLDTVDKCITYAKLVASDPDGYEGMEFMRWTSDAIGKSLTLNWEDFI